MLAAVYQSQWITVVPLEAIRTDSTRMAQDIMPGICFLGAGVVFEEGLTIRGLTKAASIWTTTALGILVGLVSISRPRSEPVRPSWYCPSFYAHLTIEFTSEAVVLEDGLQALVGNHGFTIANLSHRSRTMASMSKLPPLSAE